MPFETENEGTPDNLIEQNLLDSDRLSGRSDTPGIGMSETRLHLKSAEKPSFLTNSHLLQNRASLLNSWTEKLGHSDLSAIDVPVNRNFEPKTSTAWQPINLVYTAPKTGSLDINENVLNNTRPVTRQTGTSNISRQAYPVLPDRMKINRVSESPSAGNADKSAPKTTTNQNTPVLRDTTIEHNQPAVNRKTDAAESPIRETQVTRDISQPVSRYSSPQVDDTIKTKSKFQAPEAHPEKQVEISKTESPALPLSEKSVDRTAEPVMKKDIHHTAKKQQDKALSLHRKEHKSEARPEPQKQIQDIKPAVSDSVDQPDIIQEQQAIRPEFIPDEKTAQTELVQEQKAVQSEEKPVTESIYQTQKIQPAAEDKKSIIDRLISRAEKTVHTIQAKLMPQKEISSTEKISPAPQQDNAARIQEKPAVDNTTAIESITSRPQEPEQKSATENISESDISSVEDISPPTIYEQRTETKQSVSEQMSIDRAIEQAEKPSVIARKESMQPEEITPKKEASEIRNVQKPAASETPVSEKMERITEHQADIDRAVARAEQPPATQPVQQEAAKDISAVEGDEKVQKTDIPAQTERKEIDRTAAEQTTKPADQTDSTQSLYESARSDIDRQDEYIEETGRQDDRTALDEVIAQAERSAEKLDGQTPSAENKPAGIADTIIKRQIQKPLSTDILKAVEKPSIGTHEPLTKPAEPISDQPTEFYSVESEQSQTAEKPTYYQNKPAQEIQRTQYNIQKSAERQDIAPPEESGQTVYELGDFPDIDSNIGDKTQDTYTRPQDRQSGQNKPVFRKETIPFEKISPDSGQETESLPGLEPEAKTYHTPEITRKPQAEAKSAEDETALPSLFDNKQVDKKETSHPEKIETDTSKTSFDFSAFEEMTKSRQPDIKPVYKKPSDSTGISEQADETKIPELISIWNQGGAAVPGIHTVEHTQSNRQNTDVSREIADISGALASEQEQESSEEPDLDQIARNVYKIIKRKLAREKERTLGMN